MSDSTRYDDTPNDAVRASDADREQTATELKEHHSAGRLTDDELQERLDRCMAAKTIADLRELVRDLPSKRPHQRRPPWARWGGGIPVVPLIVIATVLASVTFHAHDAGEWHHHGFPWVLVLLIGGGILLASRRRYCWAGGRHTGD